MSARWIRRLLVLALSLATIGAVNIRSAPADEPATDEIAQDEPAFFVHGDVNRTDRYYRDGDALGVTVTSEQDAYVYVLYEQADGKVFQIFPNSAQKDNKVRAKTAVQIPAADDQFRWKVGAPFGKEVVKVIASKEPIDPLNEPAQREQRFNPVSQQRVKAVAAKMKDAAPVTWAEDRVEITTAARGAAPPQQGRRFGVYFGNSVYIHNADAKEAAEGKWEPDLPCPANNATVLDRLMKSMGRVDDSRIYLNEKATKKQMEETITGWLPSVSRPGDTVFIYFSGHGGPVKDDNGDETDGQDEYLLVNDYVDLSLVKLWSERHKAGKLDPALLPRLKECLEVVTRAGSLERGADALTRYTCVTDDLLGHWCQRLAGRKIVVLLDCCYAGGLATEKGFASPALNPNAFDFLDGEMNRLKDIGQPESCVLAACSGKEVSYALRLRDDMMEKFREQQTKGELEERVGENLGVFTYHVVESLVTLPPPLDIAQTHAHCREGMRKYFVVINDILVKKGDNALKPHESHFFNFCSKPPLLKP